MWKPVILVALFTCSAEVRAQTSVQDALQSCETFVRLDSGDQELTTEVLGAVQCATFMRGIGTMLVYSCTSKEEGYLPLYAADPPPSTGAAAQAYINWARANPALWGESAVDGIILALMEAFPCSN